MHCLFVYPFIKQVEYLDGGYGDCQIHGKATVNWFIAKMQDLKFTRAD